MENNDINRTILFSQYMYQQVLKAEIVDHLLMLNPTTLADFHEGDHLILKPLSSITDEDAEETGFGTSNAFNNAVRRNGKENFATIILSIYDIEYLRSKGYALPFMGLSVDKLIEYGWIKLA